MPDESPPTFGSWSPDVLGRREARRVGIRHPARLSPKGIDLTGLAADLNVDVSARADLRPAGQWRIHRREPPTEPRLWGHEQSATREVIEVRSGLDKLARRFAIAHELGHAVLQRRFSGRGTELPIGEQERFANAFAADLLLLGLGDDLDQRFRGAANPLDLLELAKSVGAPVRVLLIRAHRENWLARFDVLWLDIRTIANMKTGRNPRPRIYHCVRDRRSWFLPENRSVAGAFGDDIWLWGRDRAFTASRRLDISRSRGTPSKLVHERVPVEIEAFRMRQPSAGFGPEVLAHVSLLVGKEC